MAHVMDAFSVKILILDLLRSGAAIFMDVVGYPAKKGHSSPREGHFRCFLKWRFLSF